MTMNNETEIREGGSAMRRYWTDAEIAVLREFYPLERCQDVARRLGRSVESVFWQVKALGILKRNVSMASSLSSASEQAEEARRLFAYDPGTGRVTWKVSRADRRAGDVAGTVHHNGYYVVRFLNKFHRMHRVIWLHQYGEWPKCVIDHINGDGLDNRLCNLRDVTVAQNQWNRVKKNRAVYWNSNSGKWTVSLTVNGERKYFGSFSDKQQATEVAEQAIKEHHGEFARY